MDERQNSEEPEVQTDAARGGSGGGKTAIGAGTADGSDPPGLMQLAQEEARRLGHNFIGTELLLIAYSRLNRGLPAKILTSFGFNVDQARIAAERIIGRGDGVYSKEIPFTPRAKLTLNHAWQLARELGHNHVESEHYFLALLEENQGVGARMLENLDIDRLAMRERVLEVLKQQK